MELFWELAFTIALSLLLPLIFIMLLSVTPNFEANEKVAVIGRDRDHGVKSDSHKWETEEVVQIVGKFDEFRDKSILGKLIVPETVDMTCGSPKIRNSGKVDENRVYNEVELADLAKNPVEEISHDCGCVVEEVGENRGLVDEDDWEGIERTELESSFGAALVFVGSKSNANRVANLSNDVKMKLYGYHRIVTQGPCREPRPMAIKFSARAKWNAWKQLGIMSPELAMERYISLLSESIPGWMADYPYENAKSASADIHAFAKLTF